MVRKEKQLQSKEKGKKSMSETGDWQKAEV